jgi:DNA-binding beta-propeller fold protein YncE
VTATVSLVPGPLRSVIRPSLGKLFVVSYPDIVFVTSLRTNKVIKTLDLTPAGADAAVADQAAGTVFVAGATTIGADRAGGVAIINARTDTITGMQKTGNSPWALDVDTDQHSLRHQLRQQHRHRPGSCPRPGPDAAECRTPIGMRASRQSRQSRSECPVL